MTNLKIQNRNMIVMGLCAASLLSLPVVLCGCDREVSHSTSKTTRSDGTVKTEEKTIKKAPDGTIIKEETEKSKTPPSPP